MNNTEITTGHSWPCVAAPSRRGPEAGLFEPRESQPGLRPGEGPRLAENLDNQKQEAAAPHAPGGGACPGHVESI